MPIKYIPHDKPPVTGQAILANIARPRLLRYAGDDEPPHRLARGMPYYETRETERVGDGSGGMLLRGECLSACAMLRDRGQSVDLVYIDPPFASGARYAKQIILRGMAEEELSADMAEDMYDDIWQKENYLNWMYENLSAIRTVMSDTGSIFVHLDSHIGHYVKILMDEVFGEENFINEIIWCYTGPSNSKSATHFVRKHDSLFFYAKSADYVFNAGALRVKYKKSTSTAGKTSFTGITDAEKTEVLDARGKLLEDWWTDIATIGYSHSEIVNYPTQKPEALLRRIITAASTEGMRVADFFGGSGTTAKVAHDMGRRFLHVDVGLNAIQTTRQRLVAAGASFTVSDVADGLHLFRNPAQTMQKLPQLIDGMSPTLPDDLDSAHWQGAILHPDLGLMPVILPDLNDSSQRVLDETTLANIIYGKLAPLSERAAGDIKRAIIYYVDMDDAQKLQNVMKTANKTGIDIELRDLKTVLDFVVLEDEIDYRLENGGILNKLIITRFTSDRMHQLIDAHNAKIDLVAQAGHQQKPPQKITLSPTGLELIDYVSLDCTNATGAWQSDSELTVDKHGHAIIGGKKSPEKWNGTIEALKKPKRLKIRNIAGDETLLPVD